MPEITIGSTIYSTYSDLADADVYFNASIKFASWDVYTNDQKGRGLVSATRVLNRQTWQGIALITSPFEGLSFPRSELTDKYGDDVDETIIPPEIIEASQLLALSLLDGDFSETTATQENLTKRLKAGSVEIENFRADPAEQSKFPSDILDLISPFLASSVEIAGSLAYGTDGTPSDPDFSLNEGF